MAPVIYFWKDELQWVRLLNTEGEQKRAAHNPSIEIRILLSKQDVFHMNKISGGSTACNSGNDNINFLD